MVMQYGWTLFVHPIDQNFTGARGELFDLFIEAEDLRMGIIIRRSF
jgi:hypothetical protein